MNGILSSATGGLRRGCRSGELAGDAGRVMCVAAEADRLAAFGPPPGQQAGIEREPAAGVDLHGAPGGGQCAQRRAVGGLEVGAVVSNISAPTASAPALKPSTADTGLS